MSAAHTIRGWVVPEGLPEPEVAEMEVAGWTVRHPDGDADWIGRVARRVRRGASALRSLPADELVGILGSVGVRFLDPSDPLRREALDALPATAGVSPEMAQEILDGMADDWTQDRLRSALEADVGSLEALDGTVRMSRSRTRALGPQLSVQVVSGSVPGVGATALLRSLLVKGPTLVKPGRGDVVLPVLMARELARLHPVLEEALAVVYWPGGRTSWEDASLAAADVAVAYGSDASVKALRDRTPVTTRFIGYHHRVSLGMVGRGALSDERVETTAGEVARAVALFDQRGCVSPQVIYVERGGARSPEQFAREVAAALAELEEHLPSGRLDPDEASTLQQIRGTAELLEGAGEGEVYFDPGATWTVLHEEDPDFTTTCVGRVVRVKPVDDLTEVPELLAPVRRHLQTVGLAGGGTRLEALVEALGRVGATRVAAFSEVPFPPAAWRHDGRGPLAVFLRWVDVEG